MKFTDEERKIIENDQMHIDNIKASLFKKNRNTTAFYAIATTPLIYLAHINGYTFFYWLNGFMLILFITLSTYYHGKLNELREKYEDQ